MFKKAILFSITLCLLLVGMTAFASYKNWTNYETSYLHSATVRSFNYSRRYTNSNYYSVHVQNKTMFSTPRAILVNSDGDIRSNPIKLNTGDVYGDNNRCVKRYIYYLRISPAWNQLLPGSIKYKFSVR